MKPTAAIAATLRCLFLLPLIICLVAYGAPAQPANTFVRLTTPQGSCIIKLYNETPAHRDNFIKLVKAGYFNATTFNRILKGFVVQGGDADSLYEKKDGLNEQQKWIEPEFNRALFHKRGAVAMGRDDNAAMQSFTTQFYLVDGKRYTDAQMDTLEKKRGIAIPADRRAIYRTTGGTPFLDGRYTVFGEIVSGLELIDKLVAVKVDAAGNPATKVWIKLKILSPRQAAKAMQ